MTDNRSAVAEIKMRVSDPTALGVFGLAMVTLVASPYKIGWIHGNTYAIAWAVVLGSLAQLWAASMDFRNNNYFGSIVLGVYGLFWMAVACVWMFDLFAKDGRVPQQMGFAYIGYLVFSLFVTVAALEANRVFAAILVLIDVLFICLALAAFGVAKSGFTIAAGYAEFAIGLLGLYATGAIFLNNFFGRVIVPIGKPFGFIKKS